MVQSLVLKERHVEPEHKKTRRKAGSCAALASSYLSRWPSVKVSSWKLPLLSHSQTSV